MNYVRFWIRSVLLLVPLTFVLLYFVVHVPLAKVLLAVVFEAAFGIITVVPFVFLFRGVDRSIWSEDEYERRVERRRRQIAEQRRLRDLQYNGQGRADSGPKTESPPEDSRDG